MDQPLDQAEAEADAEAEGSSSSSQSNFSCFGSTITIDKPHLGKFFRIRGKKQTTLLCLSVSGNELIAVEMDKDRVGGTSPRGVLDNSLPSSESDTSSSKTSATDLNAHSNPKSDSQWRVFVYELKSRSMRGLSNFPHIHPSRLSTRRSRSLRENAAPLLSPTQETDIYSLNSSWKNFTFAQLQSATKNFSQENLIGKGGYAEVYKGRLQDGHLVAVKRLTRGTQDERIGDFLTELGIMVHINHPNTAKLIGYGIEGGMHLVLELSPHGSLSSLLHGPKEKLKWSIRYKIALGIAEGLLYLHEGCPRRIIHRDIKSSNILLTEDFEPQICDYGLAKWLPEQWTHHTVSNFEGTFGFLAPEYLMHGIVDEKTDVFAFGVLLLELITGRLALDNNQQSLVMWAKPFLNKNNIRELIDPSLDGYDFHQLNRMASTASLCIQDSSNLRPPMRQVVKLLQDDETGSERTKEIPRPLVHKKAYSEEIFEYGEYNTARYMNDLKGHKKGHLE